MPDQYEKEIQNTEVKGQDILKSEKERAREVVKFQTNVLVAKLAVNATLESAYGAGNKTVYEAEATASTVQAVIKKQAEAYSKMKTDNKLQIDELLLYMKHNLIKDYSAGKIAIGLQ